MKWRRSTTSVAAQQEAVHERQGVSARALAIALLCSVMVALALQPLALALQANQGHDFLLLYAAAHAVRDHQNPYDAAVFLRFAQAAGVPAIYLEDAAHQLSQPYVYPPLFAWLVIPFTYLKPLIALLVWRVFSAACVFVGTLAMTALWAGKASIGLVAGNVRRVLLAALVTVAPVTLYGLYWGNPVVVVYAAIGLWIWALLRNTPRMDVLAGGLMSVALLKPQLALPLAGCALFCLVPDPDCRTRRWRIGLSFVVTCSALFALDVLLTGPALLVAWPRSVLALAQLTYSQREMPSLVGLLVPIARGAPGWVQVALPGVAALLGLVLLVWALRGLRDRMTNITLLALLTIVWCFAAPYAHANDEILLVPGALALLLRLPLLPDGRAAIISSRRPVASRRLRMVASVAAIAALWLGGLLWVEGLFMEALIEALTGGFVPVENVTAALAPILLLLALCAPLWQERQMSRGCADLISGTDAGSISSLDAAEQIE